MVDISKYNLESSIHNMSTNTYCQVVAGYGILLLSRLNSIRRLRIPEAVTGTVH